MTLLTMFLLVLAAVLFFLTGLGVGGGPRFNFLGFGLFCCVLALLIERVPLR